MTVKAPQFFTCTCTAKPGPHLAPVQRIAVAAAADFDADALRDALMQVWYDATLFYGPDVVMVVAYEGDGGAGAAAVAREWAGNHDFAAEPHDGEPVAARIAPEGVPQAPGESWPVYRYAA
ncbi:hypothetical protein [Streptomyces rubradiris]|uniref:hypothetical protein n=1 Tax=Streptomyces rubradiris TaxID=285531 RepID=UPI0019AE1683|nr:hypothetical protein [Streptomyces rubradiris]GHH25587.1 hypothetical protein GCM10018792_64730 [Streptomyces rubradiris]